LTKVYANNIAYIPQLGNLDNGDRFSSMDLANSRLLSLPINFIEGVAGDFKKGDRLDLLFKGTGKVSNATAGEQSDFVYSKIFLQDIPIYQVNTPDGYKFTSHANVGQGEKLTADGVDLKGEQQSVSAGSQTIGSVTLLVTPEQAEQIEARRLNGDIKVLKRFPESQTHETLGFVIGNYGKVFSGNANAETGSLQVIDSNYKDVEAVKTATDKSGDRLGSGTSNSSADGKTTNATTKDGTSTDGKTTTKQSSQDNQGLSSSVVDN